MESMPDGRLPDLVRAYLEHAVRSARPTPAQVCITQTGTMWSKPGARPMHFAATERFAVDRVAFCWRARFRIAPAVAINVSDCYDAGEGSLRVKLFGVPLQRRSGPEVALAEAFRYLAELPWAPFAIAANRELDWEERDARSVEVSCRVNEKRLGVIFDFDASGDIVRCSAAARPRDVGGETIPTPWGGELSEYRPLDGIRLPTFGEVYWDLPEGRFVYWRGRITGVGLLEEAFAA